MLNCPRCGGLAYDNSNDPNRGQRPLAKCKNKSCGWATWKPEELKVAAGASGPAPSQGSPPAKSRPPLVLDKLLEACNARAIEIGKKYPADGAGSGVDHDIITRLTGMLFIARTEGKGVLASEMAAIKEARAKAEAAKREAEEKARQERERAQAQAPEHPYEDWPPLGDPYEMHQDLPF